MKGIRLVATLVYLAFLSSAAALMAQTPVVPPIKVDLQIIGFGVDDATRAQLEEAAQAGGGRYYPAESEDQLRTALGQATGLGSGTPDAATRQAAMLVLDVSNSMWGQIDGQAKIEIARQSIRTLVGSWSADADLGLVAYGHNRVSDCSDIETLRAVSPLEANGFTTLVDQLTPRGKTPLTQAVRVAAEELAITDRRASVILFSDGIETCGGDPCALAAELENMGVDFTAYVVGFSVSADEEQLACLAETTGGLYLTADNAPQLNQALTTVATLAGSPGATDLITFEALDEGTGQPITSGVVWTVTSLASEDSVPLTAGVSRPSLPLVPGQYVAEANVGLVHGQTSFDVTASQAQTVQVRLNTGSEGMPTTASCIEPNNDFALAGSMDIAAGISESIFPQGDVDFCALDVPAAGILTIAASAAPSPVDVVVRVDDIDRRAIRDWTSALLPGATAAEADLPEPGRYIVEVSDAYSDASSSDRYGLNLAFTPAMDATEPNDSLTRAATLPLGVPVDVAIFPRGEHNFLAVEVEEHGELTVTATGVPPTIDVAMRLLGPELLVLKDWQSSPGGVDNALVVDLPLPGRYIIEIADSYDDARSPAPLKLNASFVPSVDAGEPNNTSTAAAALTLDAARQVTILPRGDEDYFLIDAPHRGRISASISGVPGLDMAMRLLDGDQKVVRDWASAPALGAPFVFEVDLPKAGKYWLHVADAYNDGRSVEPATLTAALITAEDALEPNDRPRDAKPLALGTPVQASILPRGDHDFYLLDAEALTLTVRAISLPPTLDVAFRLLDANLAMVGNWTASPAPGVDAELKIEVPRPGRYWLEVADSYDDASDPASFTLTATQP